MADRDKGAVERILRLAAYAADRPQFTLEQAATDVPGYVEPGTAVDPASEALRKKFHRDHVDLRAEFGIDIQFDKPLGLYSVQPGWFSPEERRAILAAAALVWVEGLEGALHDGALGAAVDGGQQRVVLRVHELLLALRGACAQRQEVSFRYLGRDRRVQPWAIGVWRKYWYLAGHDCERGELRRFRLDRVELGDDGASTLALLETRFERPADLDVSTLFDLDPNAWGSDEVITARVLVDTDHRHRIHYEFDGCRAIEGAGDRISVEIDVRNRRSFIDRILCFGTHAVVVDPEDLVAEIRAHLTAIVEVTS